MADPLTTVTILLAVVSTTFAIASFVFSWVSFRNTSQMQMNAQAILAQISQRVEVVVERTSQQMDKAWEYFTSLPPPPPSIASEELAQREEELRAQIIEEAREEAAQVIKQAGLDTDVLKRLLPEVEDVIGRSAERSGRLFALQEFLLRFSEIERELRDIAAESGVILAPDDRSFRTLVWKLRDVLPAHVSVQIVSLEEFRAKAVHPDFDWSSTAASIYPDAAYVLLDYLRMARLRLAKRK